MKSQIIRWNAECSKVKFRGKIILSSNIWSWKQNLIYPGFNFAVCTYMKYLHEVVTSMWLPLLFCFLSCSHSLLPLILHLTRGRIGNLNRTRLLSSISHINPVLFLNVYKDLQLPCGLYEVKKQHTCIWHNELRDF